MKKIKVSKNEMKHSSRGIFSYLNRKPVKMLKGGHGERNIQYLQRQKLPHAVDSIDSNGVRHGHITCHSRPRERQFNGHVWFPQKWDDSTISKAGEHIANLKKNIKSADHVPMHGKYKGVYVVVYKSRGRICGICPKFQQKKGR